MSKLAVAPEGPVVVTGGAGFLGGVVVEQGYSLSDVLSHFGAGRMRAVFLRTAGVSLRLC